MTSLLLAVTIGATVAVLLALAAFGFARAIARFGDELPRALAAADRFGREMRPALIRVRSVTEDLRSRTPQA
ncbi:MAG: hypothetical protein ACRDV7_04330 [Acidimicrobiia bacterium]